MEEAEGDAKEQKQPSPEAQIQEQAEIIEEGQEVSMEEERLEGMLQKQREEQDLLEASLAAQAPQIPGVEGDSTSIAAESAKQESRIMQMQQHIDELLERNVSAQREYDILSETLKRMEKDQKGTGTVQEEMQMRCDALERQLQRREAELERLASENDALSSQLKAAINAKCEALVKTEEVASKEVQLEHKERRMEQEGDILRGQIDYLTQQLNQQGTELLDARRTSGSRLVQLECQLREKTEELRVSEDQAASFKESLVLEQRRNERLTDKLKAARDAEVALQETHVQEVQAQTRLASLYQEESKDAQKESQELTQLVQELQKLLREASSKYGELDNRSVADKERLENELERRDEAITALKQELKDANTLLEQTKQDALECHVAALSPSAAAASRLVKSGLTLTQIYSQYACTVEQLELEKSENLRLSDCLNTMLKELEERAPQMAADRDLLEQSRSEVQKLVAMQDSLLRECEEARAEMRDAKRSSDQHARDKARLKMQVEDLSRQVVVLVRETEALRNHRRSQDREPFTGQSSSELVTQRLLPFRDVEELQQRNIELLAVVRQLSARAEEAEEVTRRGEDVCSLLEQLNDLSKQLADLQERENQHSRMMQAVIEQRNFYREQAEHSRNSSSSKEAAISPMKMDAASSPLKRSATFSPEDESVRAKLKKVEDALAVTTQDFETYRKDRQTHSDMLTEQLETMRTELSETKLSKAKLIAQSDSREEQLTRAQNNVSSLKRQLEALEKKCSAQDSIISKHELALSELRAETFNAHSKLSRTEVALESAQNEVRLLRVAEGSYKQECAVLRRSTQAQSMLQASMEDLKLSLERSASETTMRLEKQVDEAQAEVKGLRNRLQEEASRMGEELAQLQAALSSERSHLEEERASAKQLMQELDQAKERLAAAQRDVQALRMHRNPSINVSVQTEVFANEEAQRQRSSEQKVSELERRVTLLQGELERAHAQRRQFCDIAEATEKQLEVQKQQEAAAKEASERNAQEAEAKIACLTQRINSLETELNMGRNLMMRSENQLREELAGAKTELERVSTMREALGAGEEACTRLKNALVIAEERALKAEEKYAKEVEQHASDLQPLATLRKQASEADATLAELRQELAAAKDAHATAQENWNQLEACLIQGKNEQEARLQELLAHNSTLHDQLQLMGAEMIAIKQGASLRQSVTDGASTSQADISLSGSFSEEEQRSSEQLMQVVRYIRREKDIAISRSETLQAEIARLRVQLEMAEREVRSSREATENEDRRGSGSAAQLMTQARYEELMRRLETLNALTDSNSVLREECATLRKESASLRDEVQTLTTKSATSEAETRKATERIESLQGEVTALRGEAARWRTRANQLMERANRTNPEDHRRLLQEKENLLKMLASERENLAKEREELRRARVTLAEREGELTRARNEAGEAKTQVQQKNEENTKITESLGAKEAMLNDLRNKEMQVRKIAKKYKMQFEELTKTVAEEKKQQQEAELVVPPEIQEQFREEGRREGEPRLREMTQQLESIKTELESSKAESEALRRDALSMKSVSERAERAKQVLNSARHRISQLTTSNSALTQELETLKSRLEAMEQGKEEDSVRVNALKTQYEGRVSRLEKENNELREAHAEQERRQRMGLRQDKPQGVKPSTSSSQATNEPPTANIRPMAGPSSTAKAPQSQQSATVTPTSRNTPMARLRPMSLAASASSSSSSRSVAILTPSQQQTPSSSSGGPSAVVPVQGVQVAATSSAISSAASSATEPGSTSSSGPSQQGGPRQITVVSALPIHREDPQTPQLMQTITIEPCTSQAISESQSEDTQSVNQAVALVRPQEVQPPAVSSSQAAPTSQQAPSTSSQAPPTSSQTNTHQAPPTSSSQPGLKRPRELEGDQSVGSQEDQGPKVKQLRGEVSSASGQIEEGVAGGAPSPEEEPSSSLHGAPDDTDDVIVVDSAEDSDESEVIEDPHDAYRFDLEEPTVDEGNQYPVMEFPDEEEEGYEVGDEDEEEEEEEVEGVGAESEGEAEAPIEEEPAVEEDEHAEEEEEDENDVMILEEPSGLPRELAALVEPLPPRSQSEPSSSSALETRPRPPSTLRPQQAQGQLVLPHGYDEAGDDGIVPSTPTLFVPRRADGFSEAVSSPHVPQGRFTFSEPPTGRPGAVGQSAQVAESLEEARLEVGEEAGTGRSVPTTPLQVSPQDIVPTGELPAPSDSASQPQMMSIEPDVVPSSSSANLPTIMVTAAPQQGEEQDQGHMENTLPEILPVSEEEESAGVGEEIDAEQEEIEEEMDEGNESGPNRGSPRGLNRARRSSRAFSRRRPSGRPTPIVWDASPRGNNQGGPLQGPPMGRGVFLPQRGMAMPPLFQRGIPQRGRPRPRGRPGRPRAGGPGSYMRF